MSVSKESAGGAAIMSQLETSGDARADGVLGGQGDDTVAGENAPGGGQAHNPVEVPIDGVLPNEAVGSAKDVPPRPPSPDDVAAMLKAAEHKTEQRAEKTGDAPKARLLQFITLLFLWGGLVIAIASAFYLLVYSGVDPLAALSATGVLIAAGFIVVGVSRPDLIARFFSNEARRIPKVQRGRDMLDDPARLADLNALDGLGIAELVLEGDGDARLITRPDGVVVYANGAYVRLAEGAGVINNHDLPPRIDRLFSEQGADAAKIYKLCRAAKTGGVRQEIVFQRMGTSDGGVQRRFEVAVKPINAGQPFASWRIRELTAETQPQDTLSEAFAAVPDPILAIDRGGRIAWSNKAARARFGNEAGPAALGDIVLGETADLAAHLWKCDGVEEKARLRIEGDRIAEGKFSAFRRAGVGEGFVYVRLAEDVFDKQETTSDSVAGEVADAPFGVAIVQGELNRDAKIIEANAAFWDSFASAKKMTTLSRCLPSEAISELAAEARRKTSNALPRPVDAIIMVDGEKKSARTFSIYARPIRRRRGGYGVKRTLLYTVEITEQKRMQEDHFQDQKLKAIGNIAGEVAHDFNNLLQVVLSSCEDLLISHPAGDPAYEDLVQIRQNAQRAANLTRQLLAYSRKQTLSGRVLSITDLLVDFSRFLDRAVGENVRLELENGRSLPLVKIDRNQFENALMNLAVNARDAMAPNGGDVKIETRYLPQAEMANIDVPNLRDQDHLLITVKDSGPGIPKEIITKIFDPFFTTKEEGKGTGLGLSAVQGVIGQMGGAITVSNRDEGGAQFCIYLPAHEGEEEGVMPAIAPPPPPAKDVDYSGAGRILVVEDEPGVRLVVKRTLQKAGYEVVVADDGCDALELLEEDAEFDLVISDIMMPEIDGPTMIAQAREKHDLGAAVIFMSGYAEAAVREQLDATEDARFIQKPFQNADLGVLVKSAIYGDDAPRT